jgi:hypothetical protein
LNFFNFYFFQQSDNVKKVGIFAWLCWYILFLEVMLGVVIDYYYGFVTESRVSAVFLSLIIVLCCVHFYCALCITSLYYNVKNRQAAAMEQEQTEELALNNLPNGFEQIAH